MAEGCYPIRRCIVPGVLRQLQMKLWWRTRGRVLLGIWRELCSWWLAFQRSDAIHYCSSKDGDSLCRIPPEHCNRVKMGGKDIFQWFMDDSSIKCSDSMQLHLAPSLCRGMRSDHCRWCFQNICSLFVFACQVQILYTRKVCTLDPKTIKDEGFKLPMQGLYPLKTKVPMISARTKNSWKDPSPQL